MEYKLKNGSTYLAEVELKGFESWASNSMVKEKFE